MINRARIETKNHHDGNESIALSFKLLRLRDVR
jgi:hypothetical protein